MMVTEYFQGVYLMQTHSKQRMLWQFCTFLMFFKSSTREFGAAVEFMTRSNTGQLLQSEQGHLAPCGRGAPKATEVACLLWERHVHSAVVKVPAHS